MTINFNDVRPHAQGQWLSILAHVAPALSEAVAQHPKHVPCPVHGGKDGFRLYKDVDETGGGVCNTCGAHSDGFALIAWVNGWTLPDALQAVASYLGISATSKKPKVTVKRPDMAAKREKQAKETERKRKALNEVRAALVSLAHESAQPARNYLINRGLGDVLHLLPANLFFHPSLSYWHDGLDYGTHPALVALIRDENGKPVTYHRTYLDKEGNKADLPTVKKIMPPATQGAIRGGAVRLYMANDELILTEGIETALALYVSLNKPVWACVSAGGLEAVKIPHTVQRVIIGSDNDKTQVGQNAAKALAERLSSENARREIKVIVPKQVGTDWLDVLNGRGLAA